MVEGWWWCGGGDGGKGGSDITVVRCGGTHVM